LSWTHFLALLPIKNALQRDFYAELCPVEGWSVSRLGQKIDSMLFEPTALSRKPEKLARKELDALSSDGQWMPDIFFRDPYILDFLNLSDRYSERDLETAILRDIEAFLLEMGSGFRMAQCHRIPRKRGRRTHAGFSLHPLPATGPPLAGRRGRSPVPPPAPCPEIPQARSSRLIAVP
jgi:predicted nuclease of restriction endonuclease-like (RecB) superfamily